MKHPYFFIPIILYTKIAFAFGMLPPCDVDLHEIDHAIATNDAEPLIEALGALGFDRVRVRRQIAALHDLEIRVMSKKDPKLASVLFALGYIDFYAIGESKAVGHFVPRQAIFMKGAPEGVIIVNSEAGTPQEEVLMTVMHEAYHTRFQKFKDRLLQVPDGAFNGKNEVALKGLEEMVVRHANENRDIEIVFLISYLFRNLSNTYFGKDGKIDKRALVTAIKVIWLAKERFGLRDTMAVRSDHLLLTMRNLKQKDLDDLVEPKPGQFLMKPSDFNTPWLQEFKRIYTSSTEDEFYTP